MTKKWYESKTFWFAVLFAVVQLAGVFGFAGYTPSEDVVEIVAVLNAVAMLILRFVTKKGIEF